MDGAQLISRTFQSLPNRRDLLKTYYRRSTFYNGEHQGMPCHITDNKLNIGPQLMAALKKVGCCHFDYWPIRNNYMLRMGYT